MCVLVSHAEHCHFTAAITVYVGLASEFVLRYLFDRPLRHAAKAKNVQRQYLDRNTQLMLFSLGMSSLFIFIR